MQQFYESDDVNTMMPGQKVTKSVKVESQTHIRKKRLIDKKVFNNFTPQNPWPSTFTDLVSFTCC